MPDYSNARISHLIIHRVGNKLRDEPLELSERLITPDEVLEKVLLRYLLKPFRQDEFMQFIHQSALEFNETFMYSKTLFGDTERFIECSRHIATHLYKVSQHPKIISGELCVALLEGVVYEGLETRALSVVKSEHKDTFLKISRLQVASDEGVNINKMDKGCLILDSDGEDGYRVLSVDNTSQESKFWVNDFLGVSLCQDSKQLTRHFLDMGRSFVQNMAEENSELDSTAQYQKGKEMYDFFNGRESFRYDDFLDQAVGGQNRDAFERFRNTYENEKGFHALDEFPIESRNVRSFVNKDKEVIRLDESVEIRLKHGSGDAFHQPVIEKGYDEEKGMEYYKIYFNEEW